MSDDPSHKNTERPREHFQFDKTFTLNEQSGIYQPESDQGQTERQSNPHTVNILSRLPVDVRRDTIALAFTLIGTIIAAFTLIVVSKYTFYTGRQLELLETTTKAAKDANVIARSTAEQALESSRLDERAWVGVETVRATPDSPEANKPFTMTVAFRNSGKTPAKNFIMQTGFNPLPSTPRVIDMCATAIQRQESRTILAPNAVIFSPLSLINGAPLPSNWESLLGKNRLYAYGCILYDDIADRTHWLTYCAVMDIPTKAVQNCPTGNATGDGYPPKQ